MTISYNLSTSTSSTIAFFKVMFRWRGSVYKAIIDTLVVWILLYYAILLCYKYSMTSVQQKWFEQFSKFIDSKLSNLPLQFMLGFFVTIIIDRWKQIFQNIGFVDSAAHFVSAYVRGTDHETRITRRNLIRYLCLTQVLVLRDISVPVRKRFPNIDSLVDSGLLQCHEHAMMERVRYPFPKYSLPINWFFAICYELRQKGNIAADVLLNGLLQEAKCFREKLQTLANFDCVPVPLAYPQLVSIVVRVYFLLCTISRQSHVFVQQQPADDVTIAASWVHNMTVVLTTTKQLGSGLPFPFPFMTILELFCLMGWLKVAEALLNPLGEDDDDFECNYIIDRNIAIAMTMVDECYDQKPAQLPDQCGFEGENALYSENAAEQLQHPLVGSATMSNLPEEKKHVRMVEKRPSTVQNMNENVLTVCATPEIDLAAHQRRHSNFVRRLSTMSLNKIRDIRQSISLPIRQSKKCQKQTDHKTNGIQPCPNPLDDVVVRAWTVDPMANEQQKPEWRKSIATAADNKSKEQRSNDEIAVRNYLNSNLQTASRADEKMMHSCGSAPNSTSSSFADLRSLHQQHLEPVREDEDGGGGSGNGSEEKEEENIEHGGGGMAQMSPARDSVFEEVLEEELQTNK